jgi:predicted dehydrogenase
MKVGAVKEIKIAQIGLGAWGKNLLRNFVAQRGARVVAVCDASTQALEAAQRNYPTVDITTKPEEIFGRAEVDAVVIATPPASHFELAMAAVEAGKDVFVEKPLVLSSADGLRLVKRAEEKGRILMVGHIMVHHPASLKLKEYIDSGELGRIYYVYATRVNLGKVRDIENAMWSFAPHDISLIVFLLGKRPVRVSAVGQAYLQSGIQDVAFVTLQFPDDTLGHIHTSWLDPHKDRNLTVVGSKKMVLFDDTQATEKIKVYDKGVDARQDYATYGEYLSLRTGDIVIPNVPTAEPLALECRHFLDSVENRTRPRSDGRSGLEVLRILEAAQQSMDSGGKPVDLVWEGES